MGSIFQASSVEVTPRLRHDTICRPERLLAAPLTVDASFGKSLAANGSTEVILEIASLEAIALGGTKRGDARWRRTGRCENTCSIEKATMMEWGLAHAEST